MKSQDTKSQFAATGTFKRNGSMLHTEKDEIHFKAPE